MNSRTLVSVGRWLSLVFGLIGGLCFVLAATAGGKKCVELNFRGRCDEYQDPTLLPMIFGFFFLVLMVVTFLGAGVIRNREQGVSKTLGEF